MQEKIIKICLAVLLVLVLCSQLNAKTITFQWNSHSQSSTITGFKLYKRKAGSVYNFSSPASYYFPSGTSTTMDISISGPYFFVLKAYVDGDDCNNFSGCTECPCYSEPSNEVSNTVKSAIRIHFMRR